MITLIATGHSERGVCNSDELYKIIEQIAPEVIYEEVLIDKFAGIYEGRVSDSLETYTIKRYLQKHPIAHYPVDLEMDEIIDKRFRNDVKEIFDIFYYYSPEYTALSNQQGFLSERFGFPYLNSEQCRELLERKHFLEEEIVQNINHGRFSKIHNDWLMFIDKRREEMIKNIYKYSDLNKYERSLFLIGAEHRKPIMDKIPEFEKNNEMELDWNFNFFKSSI